MNISFANEEEEENQKEWIKLYFWKFDLNIVYCTQCQKTLV